MLYVAVPPASWLGYDCSSSRPASGLSTGAGGEGGALVADASAAAVPVSGMVDGGAGVTVSIGVGVASGEGGGVGVCVLSRVGERDGVGVVGGARVGEAVADGSDTVVVVGATTGQAKAQSPAVTVKAAIATPRTAHDATVRRT